MCGDRKETELPGYGPPVFLEALRVLLYEDILMRIYREMRVPEEYFNKEKQMEKYAVEVDPKKKPDPKKDGEKTANHDDPNVNVPKDPNKGTEPFEKKPEGE